MFPLAGGIKSVMAAGVGFWATEIAAETSITDSSTVALSLVGACVAAAFWLGVTATRMNMKIGGLSADVKELKVQYRSMAKAISARHSQCQHCGKITEEYAECDEDPKKEHDAA